MEDILRQVLITGIGGFIGSKLAEYLSSINYEIVGLDKVLNAKIEQKLQNILS